MKNLIILGSTGSIGTQTLEVVRAHPNDFRIIGISAHENAELFEHQVREFEPRHTLLTSVGENPESALCSLASLAEADLVINAIAGISGLGPTMAVVQAGKVLALANKESLVMAGSLIMETARKFGSRVLPIDSELSAVWQMLMPHEIPKQVRDDVEKIILTASGGPFWKCKRDELARVSVAEALRHPTWKMGEKVSIDSATLMNKAFEIIEARWLFDVAPQKIDVFIHRQSMVHALIQYCDGNTQAVLSQPDMRISIQSALFGGARKPNLFGRPDFSRLALTFEKPDYHIFEGPRLAYEVLAEGGIMPAVFCMADEIAVAKFLRGEIPFLGIYDFIKRALNTVKNTEFSVGALKEMQKQLFQL